jgi:hypothetical protein
MTNQKMDSDYQVGTGVLKNRDTWGMQEPLFLEDAILTRLRRGPATVNYLAKFFKVSQVFLLALLGDLQQRKVISNSGLQWHLTESVRGDSGR